MTLFERILKANKEVEEIRNKLEHIEKYYHVPYVEMYQYYHIMRPKQAEKFIEGWVAALIGGSKIESDYVPEEYKQNDNGDIWVGTQFEIGKNNIELKSSFSEKDSIGGGQFRFYENVPYYMFFKAWNSSSFEMFLLTKQQLVDEIVTRARETDKSAFVSSQGSGVISKLDNEEKIQRLYENVKKIQSDKLGWRFNTKTEPELYNKFKNKYLVDPKDINRIVNGI
jgi:hypothetical protein